MALNKAKFNKHQEQFAKLFGENRLQKAKIVPYKVISTGSIKLDISTCVGGYVVGRQYESWGPDGIGKTHMALIAMGEAQRADKDRMVAFVDMEGTFPAERAQELGVDLNRCFVYVPNSAEDVADAMKELVRSGFYSMVVLDSIGAMIPEAEKDKDADEAVVAIQAKIVTRMVKILNVEARIGACVVIYINQVRANIAKFGPTTTTAGGFALKHISTGKFQFKKTGETPFTAKVNGEDIIVGREIAIYNERNKVGTPYRTATLNLFHVATDKYGPVGVDKADEAFTVGKLCGYIDQRGAWYYFPTEEGEDEIKFSGKDKTMDYLRANPKIVEDIRVEALKGLEDEVVVDDLAPLVDLDEEDASDPEIQEALMRANNLEPSALSEAMSDPA